MYGIQLEPFQASYYGREAYRVVIRGGDKIIEDYGVIESGGNLFTRRSLSAAVDKILGKTTLTLTADIRMSQRVERELASQHHLLLIGGVLFAGNVAYFNLNYYEGASSDRHYLEKGRLKIKGDKLYLRAITEEGVHILLGYYLR